MAKLTESMKRALIAVGYEVRRYPDGWYCVDDPTEKIDGRSLQALANRGLIDWYGAGGATHQIHLELTEAGKLLFEELRYEA